MTEPALKRAAQLMLKGAKMLDVACPQCSAPLYQKDDKLLCANCNREIRVENEDKTGSSQEMNSQEEDEKGQRTRATTRKPATGRTKGTSSQFDAVRKILSRKINGLAEEIDNARDPDEIARLAEAISHLSQAIVDLGRT